MRKSYFLDNFQNFFRFFTLYSISYTSIKIVNLLIGFFLSTVMTTIVGQTGDWGVVAGAIAVTYIELSSKYFYEKKLLNSQFLTNFNSLKIGIVYGLFVDALCDLFLMKKIFSLNIK
uniref:hypothetical protein n=1 Tax=Rhodaphanes brevistipitata TaxID=446136 RepID=UPI001FCDC174|nr:hypothetical protein MW432_pgp148 [Rhodaphanes brevistipitata]UNJ18433.1 hypothetical protein [Rhodaphanes brevistipitata]